MAFSAEISVPIIPVPHTGKPGSHLEPGANFYKKEENPGKKVQDELRDMVDEKYLKSKTKNFI